MSYSIYVFMICVIMSCFKVYTFHSLINVRIRIIIKSLIMFGENGNKFFPKKNSWSISIASTCCVLFSFFLLCYAHVKNSFPYFTRKNGLIGLKCTSRKRLHNPTAVRLQQWRPKVLKRPKFHGSLFCVYFECLMLNFHDIILILLMDKKPKWGER